MYISDFSYFKNWWNGAVLELIYGTTLVYAIWKFKVKALLLFPSSSAVENLQMSIDKLQLPVSPYLLKPTPPPLLGLITNKTCHAPPEISSATHTCKFAYLSRLNYTGRRTRQWDWIRATKYIASVRVMPMWELTFIVKRRTSSKRNNLPELLPLWQRYHHRVLMARYGAFHFQQASELRSIVYRNGFCEITPKCNWL